MIRAMLVSPFPPQPTGLADYAKRIIFLTKEKVEWTLAYPSSASPIQGCHCIPISDLRPDYFKVPVIYQIGNSPHCREVIEVLLEYGGTSLLHETNMHHVLRDLAHSSNDWTSYNDHALHDYGDQSEAFLERMGKKAKSFSEYDERLRNNPLAGKLISSSRILAVLSDTAKQQLEKLAPDRQVIKMGFLPDFMERAERPAAKSDHLIIGVAGSFHYGRSWKEMVDAVAMLRRTVNCELLIVGGGWPETGHDWVKTTGRLPDKEFREELEKIDIAIDLRHDTCGETSGSMMDLLRSGIPAVVTAEGTFRDIPAGAVLRIPSESGSHGAFAALKYLLDNHKMRRSISRFAEEYFADISDREKCLDEWLDLIERSRS